MHPSVPISNATINLTYSLSHETGYNLSSYSSHSIWLIPLSYVRLILYYSNTFCLFLKTECEILESRGCANSCLQPTSHIPTSNSCITLCLVCLIQVFGQHENFIPGMVRITMNFHVLTSLILLTKSMRLQKV